MNQKQLEKEAKRALKNGSSTAQPSALRKFIEERKSILEQARNEKGKREYSNIEDDKFLPLTLASKYLPIKDIVDGVVVTTDNRFLKTLEILPVNFDLQNNHEKLRIIDSFESYLRVAPRKMQIKCVSKRASASDMVKELKRARSKETNSNAIKVNEDYTRFVEKLAQAEGVQHKFYITYEYDAEGRVGVNNLLNAKQQLEDVAETAKNYLSNCGCRVQKSKESKTHQQAEILYDILNRDRTTAFPFGVHATLVKENWERVNGKNSSDYIKMADYISPKVIDFTNRNYVRVDNRYYTHFFLSANTGYPSEVIVGWISDIANLGEGIDVDLFIERENADTMSEKIYRTKKINGLRLEDTNNAETENARNLSTSVTASDYLLKGLARREDFYYINTMVTVSANSKEELQAKVRAVKKTFKSQGMDLYSCMNLQESAFNSYMPFLTLDKQIYKATRRNVLTGNLKAFFPFTSYEMTAKEGIVLGVNASNNSLMAYDPFDRDMYDNGNLVILGSSGSGKTYTMMLITGRLRQLHIPTTIIAPLKGSEFSRFTKLIGGSYINISPGSDKCINVMEIRPRDEEATLYIDGEDVIESYMIEKVQALLVFFSLLVPDITYEEKQLVDEALLEVYKDYGITEDNSTIYDENGELKTMPILEDVWSKLQDRRETRRIANILKRLVTGSAKTFNRQTNVDLSNEYTVIDISNLKGDMLIIGMYIALEYVWGKYKEDRTTNKILAIDEMWNLLGNASSDLAAQYVLEIFKTARGYGVSAVGATQDIADFYALKNGKYGKGIINNSEIKLVLKAKPEEANTLQEVLDLTKAEKDMIKGFKRGEAMLIANQSNLIINTKSSQIEHEYISTDTRDLVKFKEKMMQQNNS